MNYGARAALLVIHKNKAFDCHLKLYKMNFVLLEQYKNKQSNQKYKCTQKICVNDFKSKLNMHSTYVWTIKSNPHYNINVNLYNKIDFIFTVSVIL